MTGPRKLEVELVAIDTLTLDPENANDGDVASIAESLRELDQHRAAVVQRSTRKVIAGNHMVMAARDVLGWTEINVTWVDDDDIKAVRRALADNATGRKATWHDDVLAVLLARVNAAEQPIPGLDDSFVEQMLAETAGPPEQQPTFPIVAQIGEKYSYVIVIAENEVDDAWLVARFKLRREQSYKTQEVNRSRVVTVGRLRQEWGEVPDAPEPEPPREEP